MLDRVAKTIARHRMFGPGDRAAVAVSGGADSVCLLDVLHELGPRWNLHLTVLHLNHNLRGEESRADAVFVAEMARGLGLASVLADADLSGRRGNLEQAARRARQQFFQEAMRHHTLDKIATGHTRSDQAETVLFRFLRGAGGAGLAAIRPVTAQGLVRPLIDIPRAAVLDYLRRRGLPWREDSTNASPRFTRNRIRHQLLPALARDYNPALEETLAHTADWAFEEEAYWEAEIDRLAGQHLRDGILPAGLIAQLPRAAARRLIRRAIQSAKGDLRGVAFSHIEQVLEMAAASDGRGRMQGPGLEVRRSFDRLRFGAPSESRSWRVPLTVPGHFALPGEGATLHLELKESSEGAICVYNGVGSCLDWERIGGPLELRSWRPGDRYHPVGQTHVERIKVLFQEARVPLWERRNWPVITCGEEILWTRRFGPAARFAARPGSRKLLTVRETSGSADE